MATAAAPGFDDRDGSIWYDGKLVPWRSANAHVLTHALHYASCVFEGERVYGGEVFKLNEHSQRLIDMICTLSKHKAEQAGYDDALMLDYRGQVAEATGANVFFVMDGELHTPRPDCFLDGITRQAVIGLARKRQMKVVERAIMPEEMAKATECFITGTAAEVTPVSEIGPYRFTPGEVCRTLIADFTAAVNPQKAAAE
jgi:branched-subunit amino acid aminotransferase/4-amino-4-deoxychorismate lyase